MRRGRQLVAGLAAALLLCAWIAGVPVMLAAAADAYLPDHTPTSGDLEAALSGRNWSLVMAGIVIVCGLLYILSLAQIASAVVDQAQALRRRQSGGRRPRRQIPGTRQLAGPLVAAVAAMFITTTTAGAATQPAAASSVVAAAGPLATNAHHDQVEDLPVYVVDDGDTLTGIAQRFLGSPNRADQIFDLNQGRVQADGGTLTDRHWIWPGWSLRLPADATGLPSDHQVGDMSYTVQPGDSLSSIAADRMGDPNRWEDLFDANRDLIGDDPDLIRPGQILTIPTPAADVDADSRDDSSLTDTTPERAPQESTLRHQDGDQTSSPTPQARASESPPRRGPVEAPPTSAGPATPSTADQAAGDAEQPADAENDSVRTSTGVGALAAVGLVGLIVAAVRLQSRRRKLGESVPAPSEAASELEHELRVVADTNGVAFIDRAMRTLAGQHAESGQPLPPVWAARLTAGQFEIYLAESHELAAPFEPTDNPKVWTVSRRADLPQLDDLLQYPAPYPALLTVGHDEQRGHLLVNLEHLGALGVAGDPEWTRSVLAAVAEELATSTWAEDLTVTMVGAGADLPDGLGTGRIQYRPALGPFLAELSRSATADREVLAEQGAGGLAVARLDTEAADAWSPHVVIAAGGLTDVQRGQLAELIEATPKLPIAVVAAGEPVGDWALRRDGEDPTWAAVEPLGLRVEPQVMDEGTYRSVLEILATAKQSPAPRTEPDNVPTGTQEPAPAVADPVDDDPAGASGDGEADGEEFSVVVTNEPADTSELSVVTEEPETGPTLCVLGYPEVRDAPGPIDRDQVKAVEVVAYLMFREDGATAEQLARVWSPEKWVDPQATMRGVLSRIRRWLGTMPDGQPRLPRRPVNGRFTLRGMGSTWDEFSQLLAGTDIESVPTDVLERAVALVRAEPFADHLEKDGHFQWIYTSRLVHEMEARIGDAACVLAERRIEAGDYDGAAHAAEVGLMMDHKIERLFRARLEAGWRAGRQSEVAEVLRRFRAWDAEWEHEPLETETEQLLARIDGGDGAPRRRERRRLSAIVGNGGPPHAGPQ